MPPFSFALQASKMSARPCAVMADVMMGDIMMGDIGAERAFNQKRCGIDLARGLI
jgi:hypothetical protein